MRCDFCFRRCDISEGGRGWCKGRECRDGKLATVAFGYPMALAIDPIEKKPLYHFLPFTKTLSVGLPGCSFSCDFCQNYQLSQSCGKGDRHLSPEAFIGLASTPSVSFTYSEPLVWQDYMIECALLAKKAGLATIMVTNGAFSKESLNRITGLIDAFNIDLKGDEEFYKRICHAALKPVAQGIEALCKASKHVEVTTMVIESITDESMIKGLGKMIQDSGVQVWHLSRFFPAYRMSHLKHTSEECLERMIEAARPYAPYVYGGNSLHESPTICPRCKTVLIDSRNRANARIHMDGGHCPSCGMKIYGVFTGSDILRP